MTHAMKTYEGVYV